MSLGPGKGNSLGAEGASGGAVGIVEGYVPPGRIVVVPCGGQGIGWPVTASKHCSRGTELPVSWQGAPPLPPDAEMPEATNPGVRLTRPRHPVARSNAAPKISKVVWHRMRQPSVSGGQRSRTHPTRLDQFCPPTGCIQQQLPHKTACSAQTAKCHLHNRRAWCLPHSFRGRTAGDYPRNPIETYFVSR